MRPAGRHAHLPRRPLWHATAGHRPQLKYVRLINLLVDHADALCKPLPPMQLVAARMADAIAHLDSSPHLRDCIEEARARAFGNGTPL